MVAVASSGPETVWSISLTALTLLIALALGVYLWTIFVETKPPRTVRNCMLIVLMMITIVEVYLYTTGLASCWWLNFILVTTLCNFWGLLDVLWTFPRVRDADSWQSVKLVVLLMLKTFVYCLSLAYNPRRAVLYMVTTFTNVWLLPIMFLVALPHGYEVAEGPRLDQPQIEDIAVSLWRVITSRLHREQTVALLQDKFHHETTAFIRLFFPMACQRWLSQHNDYLDRKLGLDRRFI